MRGAVCFFIASALAAQAVPSETDRLVATGHLWITVKYFDPAIASHQIDWDQALVAALPAIRSAHTPEAYQAAVHQLMQVLPPAEPSATGQRAWLHRGFAPEPSGAMATPFYSAFLYKPGTSVEGVSVPMGGFSVNVPISEAATPNPLLPPVASPKPDATDYPSTELRILAAYKVWGVIHYFFAYRDLLDEDWDALLAQYLPRVIAAKDATEYNLAVADWLTHAADTFTAAHSATLTKYFGEAPIGLRLRILEKHVTVAEVLDPAAIEAGVKVGDFVKKIDGETLVDRFKREEQYISGSTAQRLSADVIATLLNGSDNSSALLTVEDKSGNRKEVTLKRSLTYAARLAQPQTSGDTVQLLPGGVGYVDLRRLQSSEVAPMFERFVNTPGIIFDMRGIAADDGAITAVAARLTTASDTAAMIVTGPLVTAPDLTRGSMASSSSSFFYLEAIPNLDGPKFKGRTLMLVDERTIQSGERAALYFEAANKTEFVGSPTAGSLSVLTQFTIPGGITVSFSGEDIRHGNTGKLQRLGIQPNIPAVATLAGFRAGKDEVLDKAISLFALKPPSGKPLPSRASLH